MFISIPEEFFVPVLFSDKFTLNLENNNMEYDTKKESTITTRYRASGEDIVPKPAKGLYKGAAKGPIEAQTTEYPTEESEEKEKVEKEISEDKASDGEILSEADEEYIHSKAVEG